jgi:D-alanine-D-alanine ligase-like ATP-grasp enzyme
MSKKKIGIVRGGAGEHYEKSLKKGGEVISFVFDKFYPKWTPVDVFVDREGVWHISGMPIVPADLVNKVDVVWNTTPSATSIIDSIGIPKVETQALHNVLESNADKLREHMDTLGITMPRSTILTSYLPGSDGSIEVYATNKGQEVFAKFPPPWVVRSISGKASMGVHVAKTFPELVNAIIDGVEHECSILIEELIPGKPVTLHTLGNFRGEEVYHLPLPRSFRDDEKEIIQNFGEELFKSLGVKHYLKSDVVLSPTRGVSLLGISFMPDFRDNSHFCDSCEQVGAKSTHVFENFLKQIM